MPKLVLRVGPEAAKMPSTEGFSRYAGPTPPAGAYPAKVKQMVLKESSKGNPMFMVVMEIDAPAGSEKAKYNGCPIFNYLVIPTDKAYQYYGLQVGQINRLLDAMSNNNQKVKDAFWSNQGVLDDNKNPKLLRVGPLNLKAAKDGIPIVVDIKLENFARKNPSTGEVSNEPSIRVNDVLPPVKLTAVPDAEDEPDEYDEDDAGLVDEADYDDEVDDEVVEVEEETDEVEEDDDPEDDEPDEADEAAEADDEEPEAEPEPAPKARATRKPPRQAAADPAPAPRARRKAF